MRLALLPLLLLTAACASTGTRPIASAPSAEAPAERPAQPSGQSVANPNEADFQDYLEGFRARAASAGIADRTLDHALSGVHLNMKSLDLSSGASGGMGRIWTYLERVDKLLPRGRTAIADNRAALDRAAQRTGVDPMAIAGIWGNETNYGAVLGNFYVVEALASLAYEGRRRAFFEDELMAALTLMDQGLVTREELTGSYAGALGQVQFMPSNILKLGIDGDGDGERDLRGSLPDAFESCGNYLKSHGWRTGEPWLTEARLPSDFRWELAGPDIKKSATEWDAMGVRTVTDARLTDLVDGAAPVSILLPAGYRGVPIIAFENYRRFLNYNPSQAYAISVSQLANRLGGGADFQHGWPTDQGGMSAAQIEEMQRLLQRLGYDTSPDGRFGDKTRKAVRAWQLDQGIPADGYPTDALLARMRRGGTS